MKSLIEKIVFTIVVISFTSSLRAQMLGHTDNHEIMSISSLRITSDTNLKSKKSYSIQDFVNVVDKGLLKSKKKSNRFFDLRSDEWVTLITIDGFSIHKEAFEKGYFGSSSLKSDEYKLVDGEGNIYSVGMSVSILEELFPRSFESSVNNAEYFGRHSVVVLDGAIQGDEIVPFDSYLCFVYDQETQKVIDISYQQ